MEPKGGKETQELVINVDNKSGVPQETIDAAKKAMDVVWKNLIKTDLNMTLQFVDYLLDDEGRILNAAGQFVPGLNKIVIAVKSDSFKSFTNESVDQAAATCLFTGHEMGHKVQDFRGEKLTPNQDFDSDEYKNDPQEIEAWDIALDVFKYVYPFSNGTAEYAGRKLVIPQKSRFD